MRLGSENGTARVQALGFLVAALAGSGLIVGLKSLEIRQAFVTVAPCAVMAAYASLVVGRYFRARADQIGDNLYYLGFIFTLVSLSVSLAQFSSGGTAEEIVANFGVALATTLLGVTLRVVFNQMRTDPVETEKEARLQLAEASRRLKVELMNASAEFGMAARASRQSVSDAVDELRDKLGAALDDAGRRLGDAVSQSASGLAGASSELETQIGGAATRLADASESLRTALAASQERWATSTDDAAERNSEFNAVARKLSAAVDRLAVRMEKGTGPLDGVEERFAGLSAASEGLEARLRDARGEIEGGVTAVLALRREAEAVHVGTLNAATVMSERADGLDRAAAAAIGRAEQAALGVEGISSKVDRLLGDMDARIVALVEKASDELRRAAENGADRMVTVPVDQIAPVPTEDTALVEPAEPLVAPYVPPASLSDRGAALR